MYVSCSSQGFNFHHLNLFQFLILTVLTLTCSILIANFGTTLKNISRALSTSGTSVSSCFLFNTFISSHPFPVPLLFTFSPLLSFSSSLSSPSYPSSFSVPPLSHFPHLSSLHSSALTPLSISPSSLNTQSHHFLPFPLSLLPPPTFFPHMLPHLFPSGQSAYLFLLPIFLLHGKMHLRILSSLREGRGVCGTQVQKTSPTTH